jgi:hypothetical protein
MHYKNGREAKNGDKVVLTTNYGKPVIGVLYDAQAGNDYCNGQLAPISSSDPIANLSECLHVDDVLKALSEAPGCQKPAPVEAPAAPDAAPTPKP